MARAATRSLWQTSRARRPTRSQARSLLSIPKLNSASSRVRPESCNRIRIAQISPSLNGAFCPTSFPLFHGSRCEATGVSMTISRGIGVIMMGAMRPKADVEQSRGIQPELDVSIQIRWFGVEPPQHEKLRVNRSMCSIGAQEKVRSSSTSPKIQTAIAALEGVASASIRDGSTASRSVTVPCWRLWGLMLGSTGSRLGWRTTPLLPRAPW
jgi:hypothetical protein